MIKLLKKPSPKVLAENSLTARIHKFRSSIYGQVVYIITILAVFLFVSFGIIFKSINEEYMKSSIRQTGNNVGLLVEGALYRSMLENDNMALQKMLNIINKMPNIKDVNIYDSEDNLVYTSFSADSAGHNNPNCKDCHTNLNVLFPRKEKGFRIVDVNNECKMNKKRDNCRHLLIRSPIINEPSCYQSSCHAHPASEDVLGYFVIKIPLEQLDAGLEKSYILASFSTLLLLVLIIFFTRIKVKKPLTAIIEASEAVAGGDTSTRLAITPGQLDDLRMVSQAFNNMLDKLQSANEELHNWSQQLEFKVQKKSEELGKVQNELIHIEKIASLGKLSLSVAHEINNPLSGILIYTKLVHKQLTQEGWDPAKKDTILKHLKLIETETKRCGDIVKGLLDFSRKDQADFEECHLHEILHETYILMSHSIIISGIIFLKNFSAGSDLVYCCPNQIKQACVAILVNAYEAVSENGEIIMNTWNPDDQTIQLEITDNGSGIASNDMPHVFEPFFSTKQNVSGIGLGLAIVHGIIQSHKGSVEVRSVPGKGTTLSIKLPLKRIKGE
ncbi:MAG: ATP-binding protein [Bacteroidales bacterium]|nr:ATP-binding protein [Bacteroidales bacterium]